MNDTDIAARIRESLWRNADRAPSAVGLAEAVERRAVRRGLRHWIVGIVSGTGAVAAVFLLPTVLAQPGFGEVLGDHRIEICAADDVGTPQLWVVDRSGDGTVEIQNNLDSNRPWVDLPVTEPGYELNIGVHPPSDDASVLEQARGLTVDGHDGQIGISTGSGAPLARIDSGIDDHTVVVSAHEGDVSIPELADWVATIDIHDTTRPCEENS